MKHCKNCKAKCTGAGGKGYAPNCTTYVEEEKKPMTNADRIRNMTDEELATMFSILASCQFCRFRYECNMTRNACYKKQFKWLQSEVEG